MQIAPGCALPHTERLVQGVCPPWGTELTRGGHRGQPKGGICGLPESCSFLAGLTLSADQGSQPLLLLPGPAAPQRAKKQQPGAAAL